MSTPPVSGHSSSHYLRDELYDLIRKDADIFDFIQKGSLDGVWYWDLENPSEEWMSEQFWETFGYDPSQMPHKADTWQHMINQHDLAMALENFHKHCEDPSHPYDQVVRYEHKDRSTVWVRCRGMAIRNSDGVPIRMLGAHTDLTAIKAAEQELQEKNQQLLEANSWLTQFAYAASHDLQVPIRALSSLLVLFKEDHFEQLNREAQDLLDMIVTSADRANKLTRDTLEFSKAGAQLTKVENIDCADMVDKIISDLKLLDPALDVSFQVGSLGVIRGHSEQLRRVFQNLIVNAVKFHKSDAKATRKVDISMVSANDSATFTIADNGIGIDEKKLQKVFGPFVQLNLKADYEGTGLGLTLCQRIVQNHSGQIWAESEPGVGSRFHVKLPLNLEADVAQA